ncbi:MAG TPA: serine/threonine-protein kinase [Thermoanaerobaculia bacterium]|nr:serine/threonine-protein kinase [Thermoanaerobaculia bacterium]
MSSREPGTVLDGKYEIVRRLGSGGMGEVHLVRHLHLQELRVVKILRQDLASDPSAQARFLREARLATQIKHPNVAILYDFSRLADGSFYMVWEHIEGQDVGDRLRKGGPFPVPVAIQLGIQALRGLEAIHQTGVIHRDLSPDNLMITEDRRGQYRMKIIDLGLAKNLGPADANPNLEITQVGMFMGKLQYCSPEQAGTVSGETLDRRSDIYSFGLVLYEMLVGLPPFDSENPHGFIFKRLSEDPLPLVGRNPKVEIPAELDRVIRRALERDREKRYSDAVLFIGALEKVGKSLAAIETQEIPVAPPAAAGSISPTPPAVPRPAPRQRSSSDLSPEEKKELLAQIDRAGRRAQESTQVLSKVEVALAAGRLDEAREVLRQVEAVHPRAQGLEQLKWRVKQAEDLAGERQRVAETEQVLAGYLEKRQLALSRLALDTLLELHPGHPKRADYEAGIERLAREIEQEKRAEKALAAGRAALATGDFRAAQRELEVLARTDAARAAALKAELEAAERGQRQETERDEHRRRLEELLAERRVAEAERELQQLSALEVTKVTLDTYRARLDEVRSQSEQKTRVAEFERRYRIVLEHQDWYGAREVAREFETAIPTHPRVAAMLAEIDRLETAYRRQEAVEQGVQQIETFVGQGDGKKAELALKVLLQMDPDNRHRRRLERAIKGLAKG